MVVFFEKVLAFADLLALSPDSYSLRVPCAIFAFVGILLLSILQVICLEIRIDLLWILCAILAVIFVPNGLMVQTILAIGFSQLLTILRTILALVSQKLFVVL